MERTPGLFELILVTHGGNLAFLPDAHAMRVARHQPTGKNVSEISYSFRDGSGQAVETGSGRVAMTPDPS